MCETAETEKTNIVGKKWPAQNELPEQKNAVNTPLINPQNVYLSPLHIKLGLKKNKAIDKMSHGFMYL